MIYVTSDLHGCSVRQFKALLDSASFTDDDFLFILGDVIDRGEYGAELLLWLTEQTNMQLILGNHEALLLACDFLFEEITEESLSRLKEEQLLLLQNWMENGGSATMNGLWKLNKQDPELVAGIIEYLQDCPLWDVVKINGKEYVLAHAGLGNFSVDKPLDDYTPDELLMVRPDVDTVYYTDRTVIFGHTPTAFYGEAYAGKILQTQSWICIDTGLGASGHPALLRLDDMKVFYG